MTDFIVSFWDQVVAYITGIFDDITEYLSDLPILLLEEFLDAIYSLINSIPVPPLFTDGLNSVLSGLDPTILYTLSNTGFNQALGVLGVGLTFRLLRKLFTLGQW